MGIEYAIRVLFPGARVTARGLERFHFQPWGRGGGEPGACSSIAFAPPGEDEREIGKIDVLRPPPNSLVIFRTPGGGGWGDPYTRDPQAVLADVAEGLVSPEAARAHYGVALIPRRRDDGPDGGGVHCIDQTETERLRRERLAASPAEGDYSFGHYRATFEAELPGEVQRTLNRLVAGRPPIAQRFFRQALVEAIRDHQRRGEPLDLEADFAVILRNYGLDPLTVG
jgi:N-methylhydantoinase B